jgi:hypothetical protein
VVAIKRPEVTSGHEPLFVREFASLRSGYFAYNSPGASGHHKEIAGVSVTANGSLSFNFGKHLKIEHHPGKVVTVGIVVDVSVGGNNEMNILHCPCSRVASKIRRRCPIAPFSGVQRVCVVTIYIIRVTDASGALLRPQMITRPHTVTATRHRRSTGSNFSRVVTPLVGAMID